MKPQSTPQPITGYTLDDKYLISGGKMYRLELLTNDTEIAEAFNGGDALPIMGAARAD